MNYEFIWILIGALVLSVSVSYGLWAKLRIVLLRQDLFVIRDRLWDRAGELSGFDDPAYRHARKHLNDAVRIEHPVPLAFSEGDFSHDEALQRAGNTFPSRSIVGLDRRKAE